MTGPIFICGTGRCGTSWLQSTMRQHSNIFSTKSESLFAVTPGGLLDVQREMTELPILKQFRERLLGPWFRKKYREGTQREYEGGLFYDISREELETLLSGFETQLRDKTDEAFRCLMEGVFTSGMHKAGKIRWLEKTPRNVIYMKELHRLFPEAKFIHIIRDGRDVAVSLVENFWPIGEHPAAGVSFRELPRNIQNAARYWRYFLDVGLKSAAELPPGTCLDLLYEDLMDDPENTLRRICEFIEEPFEEILLRFKPKPSRRGRWREVFTSKDNAVFEKEAGDMLIRMGYEHDDSWVTQLVGQAPMLSLWQRRRPAAQPGLRLRQN